ncbi:TATA box-binding protein-like protein 2 [Bonamia ostreae]|uniref:TATA box-binding protein-like protein 2 n=1 Tax=Bonamia ostreae TaxID=126728 RepID=A0ABV2AEW3_9EUKA
MASKSTKNVTTDKTKNSTKMDKIKIQFCYLLNRNVVSSFDCKCELDLKQIARGARNSEYNPQKFSAVIMRIRSPKTTALLFKSGKVIVTGAKRENESLRAARKFARIVQKLSFPVKFSGFSICNMVGSLAVDYSIRLEGLAYDFHNFSSYEPELFPGLVYRMKEPKVVFLVFVTGKIVVTGAKKEKDMCEATKKFLPIVQKYRKTLKYDLRLSDFDESSDFFHF